MSNNPIAVQHRGKASFSAIALTAIIAWLGLIIQIYVTLSTYAADRTLAGVLIQFFTYFTVLSNLAVAIGLSAILLSPASSAGRFFSDSTTLTAIALYIAVVGLVFNTVLRDLLTLAGLGWWANEVMHVIVPVLYMVVWLFIIPKSKLQWQSAFSWLWVPFVYMIVVMIRGAICGLYPYPFMNAIKLGYGQIAINFTILFAVFLIIGLVLVMVSRLMAKK